MSISSEFMNAILAMDSYNRGYNPGIDGLGGIGSSIGDGIGNATVVSEDRSSDAQDVGFYAVAYEWNGERAGVCPIGVKLSQRCFLSLRLPSAFFVLYYR
ncbi:MAG: hypothetical protein H0X47_21570 [Nitrospirales bacterium]|nr:hypothetical protein [Nitrospirales bacterium]